MDQPATVAAHDPATAPPSWLHTAVRRLEDEPAVDQVVDSLMSFARPLGRGEVGDVLRGRWLGHALHPMLTDLPIGCWTSAALLDVVGGSRGRDAAQRLIGLGLLFVPVTAAAGLADWSTIRDEPTRRVGAVHAALNVVTSACYLQSWRHRRKGRHWRGIGWGMAGGTVASAASYLGGHLAFGSTEDDDAHQGDLPAGSDRVRPDLDSGTTSRADEIDLRPDGSRSPVGQSPVVTESGNT